MKLDVSEALYDSSSSVSSDSAASQSSRLSHDFLSSITSNYTPTSSTDREQGIPQNEASPILPKRRRSPRKRPRQSDLSGPSDEIGPIKRGHSHEMLKTKKINLTDIQSNSLEYCKYELAILHPGLKNSITSSKSLRSLRNTLNKQIHNSEVKSKVIELPKVELDNEQKFHNKVHNLAKKLVQTKYPDTTVVDLKKSLKNSKIQNILRTNLEVITSSNTISNIAVPVDIIYHDFLQIVRTSTNFVEYESNDDSRMKKGVIYWIASNEDLNPNIKHFLQRKKKYPLLIFTKEFICSEKLVDDLNGYEIEYFQFSDILSFDKTSFDNTITKCIIEDSNAITNDKYHYDGYYNIDISFIDFNYITLVEDIIENKKVTTLPNAKTYLRNLNTTDIGEEKFNTYSSLLMKLYSHDLINWDNAEVTFKTNNIKNKIVGHLCRMVSLDSQKFSLKLKLRKLFKSDIDDISNINDNYCDFAFTLLLYSSDFIKKKLTHSPISKIENALQTDLVSLSHDDIRLVPEAKSRVNGFGFIDLHISDKSKAIEIKLELKTNSTSNVSLVHHSLSGFFQVKEYDKESKKYAYTINSSLAVDGTGSCLINSLNN